MKKRHDREKRDSKKKRDEKYISILPFFEKVNLWEVESLYFFISKKKSKKENDSYKVDSSNMKGIINFLYSSQEHFYRYKQDNKESDPLNLRILSKFSCDKV